MSESILDVEDFMDRVQGDKDLFFELLEIFTKDFYAKRKELGEAISAKDNQSVEHISHFLKGSCGNISAKSLRDIFHEMEMRGKANELDGIENFLGEIDEKFEELLAFVKKLRAEIH